jgi:hypothetical protein
MEVVTSPLQTPVSGKGGKTPKTSRLSKSSKSGSQSAAAALGEYICFKLLQQCLIFVVLECFFVTG